MSRTYRKSLPSPRDGWVDGFEDRIKHGLVRIPLKKGYLNPEHPKAKKFAKRQFSRAQRRKNRHIDDIDF